MKKIVGIIAAAALAAGMATAQDAGMRLAGWGRVIWEPVTFDGDKLGYGTTTSWGGSHREGVSIIGSSDYVGMEVDICGETMSPNDGAFAWVKPLGNDILRLDIGRVRDDTLCSDACYGMWNWRRIGVVQNSGENFIFVRNVGGDAWLDGANLRIAPIEGLYIGLGVGADNGQYADSHNDDAEFVKGMQEGFDATDVWPHKFHGAVGYTIDGIGTIKVGAFGEPTGKDDDGEDKFYCMVNAAFELTAVENLYAAVGAKINTAKVKGDDVVEANLYGRYNFAPFTFHAIFGSKILQWNGEDDWDDFGWMGGVGADIDIGNGMGFNVDVRLQNVVYGAADDPDDKDGNNIDCAFLVGFYKGFSNGKVSIGFEGGINDAVTSTNSGYSGWWKVGKVASSEAEYGDFQFIVPVMIEYWF